MIWAGLGIKESMDKLTEIEKEKLHFLESQNWNRDFDSRIDISIFGLTIRLHLNHFSDLDYLKDYYQHFQEHGLNNEIINVFYHCFNDERKSLDHYWYNSRYPVTHFIPRDTDSYYTIERDFFSFTDKLNHVIHAYGATPSLENPDSLDNLITHIFSGHNHIHHNLILHSASVIHEDKAYVFYGESGAGKSTLAFHSFINFQKKVISSDQTYLSLRDGKLWAKSTPITIPEIKRNSPMRSWESVEVGALIHLTQIGDYGFRPLSIKERLKKMITQSHFYLTPISDEQRYFELLTQMASLPNLKYGELTYLKDSNFWQYF